jgi:hypothetical protein
VSSNQVVIRHSGLNTFPSYFNVSPGALLEALNVNIDRDQVIEPRRGFAVYGDGFGTSNDRAKQLINYKNRILRHVLTNIQWDNGSGTFTNFSAISPINEAATGLRLKSFEQNGNLYIATNEGIKKISALTASDFSSAPITQAGGIKALDLQVSVNYSNPGFLTGQSKVAYRVVWGSKDNNENLILGAPSNRAVAENLGTTSATTLLSFAIPSGVTTNNFYQVYRTRIALQTPDPIDPGDDMFLVLEDFPTSAQITAGEITGLSDITPQDIAITGAPLYTNPNGGEGIAQANEKPPFAKDVATYKNFAFYANTSTIQRLSLDLLAVDDFISGTSSITVSDGTSSETYTFRGTNQTGNLVFTGVKADYHNASPGTAKYFTLDTANNERSYLFWFNNNPVNDLEPVVPGKINIEIDISSTANITQIAQLALIEIDNTGDFNPSGASTTLAISWANNGPVTTPCTDTVGASLTYTNLTSGTGENATNNFIFLPRVPAVNQNGPSAAQQIEQAALSLVKILNIKSNLVNAFYQSGFNDVPGKILFESQDITDPSFYIYSNSAATGGEFNPTLPSTNVRTVSSSNEVSPNRIYYSKFQQPEAVPLLNYVDIGPKDKAIQRIIALRESLFVLKEDGIFRLSGDSAPFFVAGFDFSAVILSPDSGAVLNNQIYCLTSQGITTITDGGVQVISRPIENKIKEITRDGYAFQTQTFGVSYESDRAYHLWTVSNINDTVPTQCFRYNAFTNSWTRWDNTKTCGIVNFNDDKLYLGAGDINFIERERKSLTRTDYADREYQLNILLNGVNGGLLSIGTLGESDVGDNIVQTQYMTLNQFNQTLQKLDSDNSIKAAISPVLPNYFSTLQFTPGQNPRTKIVALANKLDSDPAPTFTNYTSSIANYTQTITGTTHTSSQVTINFVSNSILTNRWVTIAGSGTIPVINGTYKVVAHTGTSITINAVINTNGAGGTVQTLVNDFKDIQSCYNIIIAKLNSDPGIFFINYKLSNGSIEFESRIIAVDQIENTINLFDAALPLMEGPFTLYKAFKTTVQYAPQFAGDPSMTKQWREGTIMFENSNYSNATLGYSSDLSPFFEETEFMGQGSGDWGQFTWGQQNWGGVGAPIPFRTLIPRQKQRCRFLNVRFNHMAAREKFSIFGISLVYRIVSTRGYLG